MIEWTPINKDNIPSEESLVKNDADDMILGYIALDDYGDFFCENENEILTEATHFIELSELLGLREKPF